MLGKITGVLLVLLPMTAAGQEITTGQNLVKPDTKAIDYTALASTRCG